jgi:polyhydroxybutyrate depolymerase
MTFLDRGYYPWIVSLASLCLAGCQDAQPEPAAANTDPPVSSANMPVAPAAAAPPTSVARAPSERAAVAGSGAAAVGAGAPRAGSAGSARVPSPVAGHGSAGASGAGDAAGSASPESGACAVRAGSAANADFLGDWAPGTYPDDFKSDAAGKYLTLNDLPNQAGLDREYAVHVPVDYDKGTALPALFCLHAFSMNARSFCDTMADWLTKADKEKFILIMPNGFQNSWNIGEGCGAALLPVHTMGIDDVAFVRALLDEVGKHVNIDAGRVYATGFSNGSSLAWRLACDAADIFTAVVPVAAGSCLASCKPSEKVSVLDVYGTSDALNPTPDLPASMAAVQAANGCGSSTMPATLPMSTGASNCLTSTGCASSECSAVEVTQCIVENGSHCWFGDISTADCEAGAADGEHAMTNLAWEFLKRFSR